MSDQNFYEVGRWAARNSLDAHEELVHPQMAYEFVAISEYEAGEERRYADLPFDWDGLTSGDQFEFLLGYYYGEAQAKFELIAKEDEKHDH